MKSAEQIFHGYIFINKELIKYGFQVKGNEYIYSSSLNDDFIIQIKISNGEIEARIIEKAFNEEYNQIFNESFHGGYVNEIRELFEQKLLDIRNKCSYRETFVSPQANRISKLILDKYNESPDFPFKNDKIANYGVFRRADNKKWYGLIMNVDASVFNDSKLKGNIDVINVKINEDESKQLFAKIGIYPSYHMNKKKWASIALNELFSDNEIMKLIEISRNLVK